MTIIHFVRHGRRSGAESGDPPLSPAGRAEAERAARVFGDEPVGHVYSSPLSRAIETAETIARSHDLAISVNPLLRERANWGDLAGQGRSEFAEMWARCNSDRTFVPPVGDSSIEAGRRLERFLTIARENRGCVVAVTHGGVLADFLQNVCSKEELARIHSAFAEDPYSGEVVRECSITSVRVETGAIEVMRIASTDHL